MQVRLLACPDRATPRPWHWQHPQRQRSFIDRECRKTAARGCVRVGKEGPAQPGRVDGTSACHSKFQDCFILYFLFFARPQRVPTSAGIRVGRSWLPWVTLETQPKNQVWDCRCCCPTALASYVAGSHGLRCPLVADRLTNHQQVPPKLAVVTFSFAAASRLQHHQAARAHAIEALRSYGG